MNDTHRPLPPGQIVTTKFPVMQEGSTPKVDVDDWDFRLTGLVREEIRLTWPDLLALPTYKFRCDVHCVTTWSRRENLWEGVAVHTLLSMVDIAPEAQYALVNSENEYSASLRVDDLLREGVMLAYRHDGQLLSPEHGFPVRLVVPHLYFWKSVKWVRGIEFLDEQKRGFWEQRGYHLYGDPWLEQRYSPGF